MKCPDLPVRPIFSINRADPSTSHTPSLSSRTKPYSIQHPSNKPASSHHAPREGGSSCHPTVQVYRGRDTNSESSARSGSAPLANPSYYPFHLRTAFMGLSGHVGHIDNSKIALLGRPLHQLLIGLKSRPLVQHGGVNFIEPEFSTHQYWQ